ncbi:AAA family ATPase [Rhabdochromatium marinum]|uniref:AAA family ATPase n=1 Tax=Rhabdochromatium marinum TaxID=48729 RepID=UPI001907367F|nr:MoxR family ATPase [Rhabdochromatium marinum]MBK1650375.1 ATPase [Rhabdochromatium marinum]
MTDACPFELRPGTARPAERHPDAPKPVPYIASEELIEAVNLAIHLNRPLLLEGEAGSGKSQLAKYVAAALGLPFYPWLVRSTSKAQDGLYTYEAMLRLHDVHMASLPGTQVRVKRNPQHPMDYVRWGALGKAFRCADCPAVVLIDEIDKADIDFPNDLLTVLDDPREFCVQEADHEPIRAEHPPIVIITSNKEKGNLPAPFLRRCIYSYLRFPTDTERLKEILAIHQAEAVPAEVTDAAIERFLALRERDDLFKKPGTSELLDWLQALVRVLARGDVGSRGTCTHSLVEQLRRPEAPLPCPEVLLKLRADWQRYGPVV